MEKKLIPLLKIDHFNPVVEDWTSECQKIEEDEKNNHCNIHLYVITKEMIGVYSIAEVVDSVHNPDKKTVFHVISDGFDKSQLKSFKAVGDLIKRHGGGAFVGKEHFKSLAAYLNYNGSL